MKRTQVSISPMRRSDLDTVMAIEQAVAVVPWTRGQFADSLDVGYSGWVLLEAEREGAQEIAPEIAPEIAQGFAQKFTQVSEQASGRVIGFSLWELGVDEAHLLNLAVRADRQGQGHGAHLLRHVIAGVKEAGAAALFLEVRPSNSRALQLYEDFGFREVRRRKAYYPSPLPGTREDALVLRLSLAKEAACNATN